MEWAAASFQPRGSQCWIFDRGTLPFYLHTLTCVFSGEEIEKSASPQKPINTCCLVVNSCIEAQKKKKKKKELLSLCLSFYVLHCFPSHQNVLYKCVFSSPHYVLHKQLRCCLGKLFSAVAEFKHRNQQTNRYRTNKTQMHSHLCIEVLQQQFSLLT